MAQSEGRRWRWRWRGKLEEVVEGEQAVSPRFRPPSCQRFQPLSFGLPESMGKCSLCFAFVVALLAALAGWLGSAPIPEARLFATLIPLANGYLPPPLFGAYARSPVPEVPDDLQPASRPAGEMFIQLPGGTAMPASGLGLCCRPTAYDDESVTRSVLWFLLKGGRHLDTAQMYLNHKAVGRGIALAMARGVPREEIFVTTKIPPRFYAGQAPAAAVAESLEELGLEYVDLLLLHHPYATAGFLGPCANGTAAECRVNAWTILSSFRARGVIKELGVSNFGVKAIEELQSLRLAPVAVNQIQYNPWALDWQQEVVDYCVNNGVGITAWAPFQGTMMQNAQAFTVETLTKIAAAKGKTVPQIMLRWALQKKVCVIPGTGNPSHMSENLAVYEFSLSDEEMALIDTLRTDPKVKNFVAMGFEKTE
ncbi:hypothetical protein AB1Y20_004810 [Prymnesium parvum]|uniref:NADP-dependent oxidoreductase domain-containing protein n=1 Tax=Prymnesium parvum TaxID=97485 RepID=A0AB34J1B6_PRYPA